MDLITLEKRQPRSGLSLFAKGFRPFFLLAALHAVLMIPLWIVVHTGHVSLGDHFLPTTWHAHEMVFGYTTAVIAGFLLTAAANWTKRETATGSLLALLCGVWLVGRLAPPLAVPDLVVSIASLAFLPALAIVLARPIVAAENRRNYGILAVVVGLFLAQLVTHVGALRDDVVWEVTGPKLGVDFVVVLILVIGGRIIPAFTRNKTKAEGIRSIGILDRLSIAAALLLTASDAWVLVGVGPGTGLGTRLGIFTGALAGLTAVLSAARTRHWGFRHTRRTPLLWVLHVGYFFVPLGFALRAVSAFTPRVGTSTALHLMTAGAIGTLTLGMMARVSLGHTGRPLAASKSLALAFVLIVVAALVRVAGPLVGGAASMPSIHASGTLWAAAFLIYLVGVGPSLFRPRPDGRPG